MSVRQKLLLAFGLMLTLLAAVGVAGWQSSSRLESQARGIYEENVTAAVQLGAAQSALWELRYGFPQFMAVPEARQDILDAQAGQYEKIDAAIAQYAAGPRNEKELEGLASWNDAFTKYREARPRWFELYGAGKLEEAAAWRAKTTTPFGKASVEAMTAMIETQKETAAARYRAIQGSQTLLAGLLVIALTAGVGFALIFSRSLTRRLASMVAALHDVATGNLARRVTIAGKDEIGAMGTAFNQAIGQINAAVSAIAVSADQLASAAAELTSVSQDMNDNARRASVQAESVTNTISHVSEGVQAVARGGQGMSQFIRDIAQSAAQAAAIAGSGTATAQSTNATIERLSQASVEISEFARLISTIAEQTNLLALNATIEAARAGDAGKGFAVVAAEVKDLAQATAKATEDIGVKIDAIQASASEVIGAIGEVTRIIEQMNNAQSTIASSVEEQIHSSTEMGERGSIAADGANQILDGMTLLETSARATTDGAATTQQSADRLNAMSLELRGLVSRFQLEQPTGSR
ncbi:methyl-accepting chemotaxis protein [Paractinoplanes rishiriensis]|uniref:Methyl-accepting chemotaxis protein n=1 Tax=Paractinoplanes rishiriensis TaxID=1050105 RepID=A0A919MZX8_9ACTN|nr:methyl-accepting chemotaxis protein [Actinoplanes rishiriensis]GIF01830.1 methyl-accepting chemotaxis protein [Actinoplanes rishiriensis]